MGACCGKGSSPKDPDKAPYGPAKSGGKTSPGKVPEQKQTTAEDSDAARPAADAADTDSQTDEASSEAEVDKVISCFHKSHYRFMYM